MIYTKKIAILFALAVTTSGCVSKKKFGELQSQLEKTKKELDQRGEVVNEFKNKLVACEVEKSSLLENNKSNQGNTINQINDLRSQIEDLKNVRDQQNKQLGGLTVLSQSANENINKTLAQLEKKDKYINLLQSAKTKADSLNLALAVNLKGVLKEGLTDQDVEVKVDKTVVMINLSDNMLFVSGSSKISPKANDVLGKIAKIIQSRPELEVMVEGYTDDLNIKTPCIDDNWDLSVKRATSVVRILQNNFKIDPNKLIAAGRGEYNILASNQTPQGRSTNRRTRIVLMPKLDQFYDLLNPDNAKK
ncbi:MAG: OmpA family protein [Pseudarcicella sp.]|nr:OmpA family protein [Pseudarcicella sp.]MBP6411217.1 OmpA family protein [Pseudarcicella sp.]